MVLPSELRGLLGLKSIEEVMRDKILRWIGHVAGAGRIHGLISVEVSKWEGLVRGADPPTGRRC